MPEQNSNDTLVKKIIITCEEWIEDNRIRQDISFKVENMSDFEALGFLRLYEQRTSLKILQVHESPQS
jgi:hypothetical protein